MLAEVSQTVYPGFDWHALIAVVVVTGIVGCAGLLPTLAAIRAAKAGPVQRFSGPSPSRWSAWKVKPGSGVRPNRAKISSRSSTRSFRTRSRTRTCARAGARGRAAAHPAAPVAK